MPLNNTIAGKETKKTYLLIPNKRNKGKEAEVMIIHCNAIIRKSVKPEKGTSRNSHITKRSP